MTNTDKQIRTRPNPDCCVCGARGEPLYQRLHDRLFSVPGEWDLKKCPDPHCGLVWLDPMPIEDDIGNAYQTYYTHTDSGDEQHHSRGAEEFFRTILNKSWGLFIRTTPIHKKRKQLNLMYLDKDNPGRILEVGCGNGSRLAEFRNSGWQVEGLEVDWKAAKSAQQVYGLKIHLGAIDELKYPDETFDAIIMNHVIEHLHHPKEDITRCRMLLKPGGKLVVVTPNIESLGHRYFGEDWRDLDPPRHINIFSCQTLQKIADQAGFPRHSVFTTTANSRVIAVGSFDIQKDGRHVMGSPTKLYRHMISVAFQLWSEVVYLRKKSSGEECVLVATK